MFIKDILSISPQYSYNNHSYWRDVKTYFGNKLSCIEPSYEGIIKPGQLRRMGKALRMGIGCGLPLLNKHGKVEGIIIGTSEGGLEDCIKFLNQIVDYDEGTLTPTNFIQSTPNAVSGHLALITGNTNYNITHVNKALSFENALIDAQMLLEDDSANTLLVGSIEEISDYNFNIEQSANQFKKVECHSNELIHSNTEGTACGEGAVMFVLTSKPENGTVCITDVDTITYPEGNELHDLCTNLLKRNGLLASDIDGVIVGLNGDIRTDHWYTSMIDSLFSDQTIYTFKNLVGEYPTASSFAVQLAHDILKNKVSFPDSIFRNSSREQNNILIYNHYKGVQHSFILVQSRSEAESRKAG
jgi:hypothetical protein